jgi:hypothetical protein
MRAARASVIPPRERREGYLSIVIRIGYNCAVSGPGVGSWSCRCCAIDLLDYAEFCQRISSAAQSSEAQPYLSAMPLVAITKRLWPQWLALRSIRR